MRTLNDMPDGWTETEDRAWTPYRGLVRGTLWTGGVSVLLAGLFFLWPGSVLWRATMPVILWPGLVSGRGTAFTGLTNLACGFLVTWFLTRLMQNKAGMAGLWCSVIAGAGAVIVIAAKHVAWRLGNPAQGLPSLSLSPAIIVEIALFNVTAWGGALIAGVRCKDG